MTQIEKFEFEISKINSNLKNGAYAINNTVQLMTARLQQLTYWKELEMEKQQAIFDYQW